MKKGKKIYTASQVVSSVCMIMALLWLTVSTPFVNAFQQELAKELNKPLKSAPMSAPEEETTNPFGNSTEEKAPSTTFSEEYLHTNHTIDHFFSVVLRYHKCEDADTYIAFHGELLVPPPNIA